jgi:hypothetical protein
MKTKPLTAAAILACLLASTFLSCAQTILSGNISGTWTPSGNPYIISADATVPSGQTLTIQPGVVVWIGQGHSITVNGGIQAVGTSSQHITFQALLNTQYWNTITVNNGFTNPFNYCDFANATNALAFVGTSSNLVNYCTFSNIINTAVDFNSQSTNDSQFVTAFQNSRIQVSFTTFQNVSNGIAMIVNANNGSNATLTAYIANCSFGYCRGQAVSGVGNGNAYLIPSNGSCYTSSGIIVATITNCLFSFVAGGCSFTIYGANNYCNTPGIGYGNVQLLDNLFTYVTNAAISLTSGTYSGSSPATLINNIFTNTSSTIVSQSPWQVVIESIPPVLLVSKAVFLQSYTLNVGSNYEIQASSDLINWTNQGSVFTPTSSSWQSTNVWPVADWNQLFFRLVQQ